MKFRAQRQKERSSGNGGKKQRSNGKKKGGGKKHGTEGSWTCQFFTLGCQVAKSTRKGLTRHEKDCRYNPANTR